MKKTQIEKINNNQIAKISEKTGIKIMDVMAVLMTANEEE